MSTALAPPLLLSLLAIAPPSSGPTLAREDTLQAEVPEVLVTAPRVTLDEILDRVARGEARRESLMVDQAFTATFRIVRSENDKRGPALVMETVARVFKKRPDRARAVILRVWREKSRRRGGVEVDFRPDMSEEIVNFAFRPESRRDFRYRIVGRDLVGDHLIYRIEFEPRSLLDPSEPSGLVWVDTNDFVIVRQEVSFKRSPVALILKGVDRMVIERRRQDSHWVLWRVLVRLEANLPLPSLGRSFDVSIQLDQYAINSGIEDQFFEVGSGRRVRVGRR